MNKLLRAGKIISSLFFIGILLITYAFVVSGERVFIEQGSMELYKADTLFNVVLIVFIVFSLIMFVFSKLLETYMSDASGSNVEATSFKTNLMGWLEGLQIAVNILFITMVLYVGFINSDKDMNLMNFSVLLYIGPVAVFLSLVSLVWVLVKR